MKRNPNAQASVETKRLKSSDFTKKENHLYILAQGTIAFIEDIQAFLILGKKQQHYATGSILVSEPCNSETIRKRVLLSNKFLQEDIEWVSQNGYPPVSHFCGVKFVFDLYLAKKSRDQKEAGLLVDQILASQAALIFQGHIDLAKDILILAGSLARLDEVSKAMVNIPFDGPKKNIYRIKILMKFFDFLKESKIPSQKALRISMGKGIDDGYFSRALNGLHIKQVIPEESKNPHKAQKDDKGTVYNLKCLLPNFDEIIEAQEIDKVLKANGKACEVVADLPTD